MADMVKQELKYWGLKLENTSNIIRNVIFLLCILSIIAAIFITKDIDKIYCRGNYFDRSKDIDCPEGTILNGLIDPLPWERIEGDINTCCSPLYCTGNPDSNNDFNCPEDMIAINNSENIIGNTQGTCCTYLTCSNNNIPSNDIICPNNKILREDASTILKNTIEDCCEDLLCYGNYDNSKDIPCLFGSTEKEGYYNNLVGDTVDECCDRLLCSGNINKNDDVICTTDILGDQTVLKDSSDTLEIPLTNNEREIQIKCCRSLNIGELTCSNNPSGQSNDFQCGSNRFFVENSQTILRKRDSNDIDLCCSNLKCSDNNDSSIDYNCTGDGKELKANTDNIYCPPEGCDDDLCCVDSTPGQCEIYRTQYDCERMWGEEVPTGDFPRKKCVWHGEGGYYDSQSNSVDGSCSNYWMTDEGRKEFERYHKKKSYIYAVDKASRLNRCELPCEPQCLGELDNPLIINGVSENNCENIFNHENHAAQRNFSIDDNCGGGMAGGDTTIINYCKTGVAGYTESECQITAGCTFKEPIWETYGALVGQEQVGGQGQFPYVSDVVQDNEYVYIVGGDPQGIDTAHNFWRCKKPCDGELRTFAGGKVNTILDVTTTSGLEQLGLCDGGNDNCTTDNIQSIAVSNEHLWILNGDGNLYSCDKNSEIRDGPDKSCIFNRNWSLYGPDHQSCMRVSTGGDTAITTCLRGTALGGAARGDVESHDTIQINLEGTKLDKYDYNFGPDEENWVEGDGGHGHYRRDTGLTRDTQHTNDYIYSVVESGYINGGDYGVEEIHPERRIPLIGRVKKDYLPEQYHYGMNVKWEGVGGPLIKGKKMKEDTYPGERSKIYDPVGQERDGTVYDAEYTCDITQADINAYTDSSGRNPRHATGTVSAGDTLWPNDPRPVSLLSPGVRGPFPQPGLPGHSVDAGERQAPSGCGAVKQGRQCPYDSPIDLDADGECNNFKLCMKCGWDDDGAEDDQIGWSRISVWENYDTGPQKPKRIDGGDIINRVPVNYQMGDNGLVPYEEMCPALDSVTADKSEIYGVDNEGRTSPYSPPPAANPPTHTPEWENATTTTDSPTRCWVYNENKSGNYLKCSDIDNQDQCNNTIYIMTDPTPAPGVLSAPTRKEKVHGICKWDASECKETWHEEGNSGARPYTQPFEASRIAPNLGFAFAPHPRQNVDLNKWGNCHKEWDSDGLGWGNITPDEEIFDSTLQIDRTHQVRKHTAGALTNKLPYCGDIISGSYIDPGSITPCQGSEIPPLSLSMDNSCKLFDGNQFCNHKYMKYKHTYSDGTKIEKYYQCALDGSSENLCLPTLDNFGFSQVIDSYELTGFPDYSLLSQYECIP